MEKYQDNPFKKSGKYTKLKEGKNTLRLFDHISGWEAWSGDDGARKVIRKKTLDDLPNSAKPEAKYFRAFRVYNYDEEATQILVLTQRTILEPLTELYFDTDWGNEKDLSEFDIVISRKGEGLETEYMVTPKPKKEFDKKIDEVNLKALYENGDPFAEIQPADEELLQDMDKILGDLDA